MDSEILVALIGGGFLIISAIVSPLIVSKIKNRNLNVSFLNVDNNRQKAICGKWEGIIEYDDSYDNRLDTHPIESSFWSKGNYIIGKANYISDAGPATLKFKGGFYHNRFLRIDFKNEESRKRAIFPIISSNDTLV